MLSLPVSEHRAGSSVLSPYFQRKNMRKEAAGRDTHIILVLMTKGIFVGYQGDGTTIDALVELIVDGVAEGMTGIPFDPSTATNDADLLVLANAAISAWATANSVTFSSLTRSFTIPSDAIPMVVSGVAKSGTYPVSAAPVVAGGAGVVRFYVDSNGDGTGTAPSEVYSTSLLAQVWSATALFQPSALTVDTNKKYIDITMKQQTFATGLAGILSVITGASLTNAANGTAVNCYVIVKK